MAPPVTKYIIWCVTEDKYVYRLIDDSTIPDKCPNDTSHTIVPTSIRPVKEYDMIPDVKIQEETTPTGGHFRAQSGKVMAEPNQVSYTDVWYHYPISAMLATFTTEEMHRGDCVSLSVGEDTITGYILGPITPASTWVSQNYSVGSHVLFIHPKFGEMPYTCIQDTVSNEAPTVTTHWKPGFSIPVSSTVLAYTAKGYYIKLFDGVNQDDVGDVADVDIENSTIYVSKNPTNFFSPASPTYIQQTVYLMKDYDICAPMTHRLGESKIGGSYIPEYTTIRIIYNNKSIDEQKGFVGYVEYLY